MSSRRKHPALVVEVGCAQAVHIDTLSGKPQGLAKLHACLLSRPSFPFFNVLATCLLPWVSCDLCCPFHGV
jgi:hypothetical protein